MEEHTTLTFEVEMVLDRDSNMVPNLVMDMKLAMALLIAFATVAQTAAQSLPGCPNKCGEFDIPYPFGVGTQYNNGKDCFLEKGFNLTCDQDSKLWTSQFQISNISFRGKFDLFMPISRICFNKSGGVLADEQPELGIPPFTVSSKENKFISVGCNTYGYLWSYETIATGCISRCSEIPNNENTGTCSGIGCCQVDMPVGVSNIKVDAYSFDNGEGQKRVWDFNNCSYSFVAKNGWFNFTVEDLKNLPFNMTPLVIDWAVGNQTCENAPKSHDYACSSHNTECEDTDNRSGYRCKCREGYEGNPYLPDGCGDINECNSKPCIGECYNEPGNYSCSCPKGYEGDGRHNGKGCTRKSSNTWLVIALSVSVSVIALLVGSFYVYWGLRKRKLTKLKEKFFQQNGGILLQQQIGGSGGSAATMKIFTLEDLKKATNNFEERRILGQGGQGTVYKGVLEDSRVVAIKKSKICAQIQVEQFINEVIVLSQINHRNVVKILGCCLETEVPLLVYEFITNGTLSQHLHNQSQSSQLSWTMRLRVATETAGALAYLHSAASPPIIHRDVKTANILLDDRLTTKVSDFGASRLVPLDETQITTLVQGTFGYLDPEYFHTSQLTEKSDVYSFGVVLAELLTSKTALSFDRPEGDRNLSVYFVSSLNEGRLLQILDNHIINEANVEQLMEVANIANRCLMVKGEDRPTMKEVAMELEGLRIREKHPWVLGNIDMSSEETEYLLKSAPPPDIVDIGDGLVGNDKTTSIESMKQISLSLGGGR